MVLYFREEKKSSFEEEISLATHFFSIPFLNRSCTAERSLENGPMKLVPPVLLDNPIPVNWK